MTSQYAAFAAALLAAGALTAGCGAPKVAEVKIVAAEKKVVPGPAATAEELSGDVPALRGLAETRGLVPPELIPPEPPADPEPDFD